MVSDGTGRVAVLDWVIFGGMGEGHSIRLRFWAVLGGDCSAGLGGFGWYGEGTVLDQAIFGCYRLCVLFCDEAETHKPLQAHGLVDCEAKG